LAFHPTLVVTSRSKPKILSRSTVTVSGAWLATSIALRSRFSTGTFDTKDNVQVLRCTECDADVQYCDYVGGTGYAALHVRA